MWVFPGQGEVSTGGQARAALVRKGPTAQTAGDTASPGLSPVTQDPG